MRAVIAWLNSPIATDAPFAVPMLISCDGTSGIFASVFGTSPASREAFDPEVGSMGSSS